jgi:NADH-quinone oxidoreductase subunit N
MSLFQILLPEIILVTAACVLFLLSFAGSRGTGRLAASVGLAGVVGALLVAMRQYASADEGSLGTDLYANFRVSGFGLFIRVAALAIGTLLLLLSWPSGKDAEGNASVHYGRDAGEYFGLLLLAMTGLILVPSANDLIVLFMAIELASIPTYILVSVSRPLAVAQEAGVKYFFLGAMAAAVMLMGFAYLYGVTGTTNLHEMSALFAADQTASGLPFTSGWRLLAGVLIVVGIGFKLAAVPMHAYVADVYHGAATPVTAILGFVPKTTGIIALTKLLYVFAGANVAWEIAPQLAKLVWVVAVLTMTVGNLLALMQDNVKRVLAYSSVAHSGYLLAGLSLVLFASTSDQRLAALGAVLFYLVVYGITSTAAFGALMHLPSRQSVEVGGKSYRAPATTAETMDDLAGAGRAFPVVSLLLAISCFSLVGLPLTGGFWGKWYLLVPAFGQGASANSGWVWTLVGFILFNSALSAVYYLRIVAALFHRSAVDDTPTPRVRLPIAVTASVAASVALVVVLGVVWSGTQSLSTHARAAAATLDVIDAPATTRTPTPAVAPAVTAAVR